MEKEKNTGGLTAGNKKIIIVFTAVFLGIVLLFGIVFGAIAVSRNSRAVMSYKGVTIDRGVANYLAMMGKYTFMTGLAASGIEAKDNKYFWQSVSDDGRTYGEILATEVDSYIKRVIVGSYLFDKNTKLTKSDKQMIEDATKALLQGFGSDKSELNAAARELGFDYSDIKVAAKMIYKYLAAKDVIFGFDASALKGGAFDTECDEFFATYAHAKLLFIRTEDHFVTDPDTGEIYNEELNDSEREDIMAEIEQIRDLISGKGDVLMSEDSFNGYIARWAKRDEMNVEGGYYLASTAYDTAQLKKVYPEVVEAVYSTPKGTYTEVKTQWGVCFVYRDEPTPRAYVLPSMDRFFTDFYQDAANYLFHRELSAYSEEVKVDDAYSEEYNNLPYNFNLIIRF